MKQQILQQVTMLPWNPSTKGKKKVTKEELEKLTNCC